MAEELQTGSHGQARRDARRAWLAPTLRRYDRRLLRTDILAGLSAGAVVVPQAMAYATIAGLPVQVGLYTCMVPLLVYATLGGSRTLSMTTTSTIATLTASTFVSAGVAADADDPVAALATLTLLVGVLLLLARVLRLGSLIENISQATLTGIKAGVGATVALAQVPKLLGVPADPDATGFFAVLASVLRSLPDLEPTTTVLSLVCVAALLLLARFAPRVPAPLVVVAASILAVVVLDLPGRGVELITPVPSGLPALVLPDLGLVPGLLTGALAVAVMAFLETVAVARGVRRSTEPPIDPGTEMLAGAVASIAGAFTQALPPAGGFSQTAVNLRAGARSQVAGLTTAVLAVLVALFFAPVLDDLPQATLGALVVVATLSLIKVSDFVELARINRVELGVALVTTAVGLTAGLLAAVGVGVVLTLVLVLRELDRPRVVPLHPADGGGWTPDGRSAAADLPGVLVLHLDAGLYTANTRPTTDHVVTLVESADPGVQVVVLEASAQRVITSTVLDGLAELDRQLDDAGATLVVAMLPAAVVASARGSRWFRGLDDDGRSTTSVDAAVEVGLRRAQGQVIPDG